MADAGEDGSKSENENGRVKNRVLEGDVLGPGWDILSGVSDSDFLINGLNDVFHLALNIVLLGPGGNTVLSIDDSNLLLDL